jgi:hypothetical protein
MEYSGVCWVEGRSAGVEPEGCCWCWPGARRLGTRRVWRGWMGALILITRVGGWLL